MNSWVNGLLASSGDESVVLPPVAELRGVESPDVGRKKGTFYFSERRSKLSVRREDACEFQRVPFPPGNSRFAK